MKFAGKHVAITGGAGEIGLVMAREFVDQGAAVTVLDKIIYADAERAVGARVFAVYRSPENAYYATDGLCTHEKVSLADGLVMSHIIECPKHNGRFDYRTGEARGAPACVNLRTYPVKIEGDRVLINLGWNAPPTEVN